MSIWSDRETVSAITPSPLSSHYAPTTVSFHTAGVRLHMSQRWLSLSFYLTVLTPRAHRALTALQVD